MTYTEEQVFALARCFSTLLTDALDFEQMLEVNRRNAVEGDGLVCHTHDFCDANQIMLDALSILGHKDYDPQDEKQGAFIDRAWRLARERKFNR